MKKAKPHIKPEVVKKKLRAHIEENAKGLRPVLKNEITARVEKGPQGRRVFTLESAEHPYRVFCETINECTAIMTKGGTILHCNRRLAELLSTSIDKIIGTSFFKIVVPEDRQALKTQIQESGAKGFGGEFLLKVSAKRNIPVLISVSPVLIDRENLCVVITDISEQKRIQKALEAEILLRKETEKALGRFNEALELRVKERTAELQNINDQLQVELGERKQAEEALRSANVRIEMAQHAAGAGTWDWDIIRGFIEWSPRMFELFGLDPHNVVASFELWETVLHPEDKDDTNANIDRALKEHTLLENEYRIIRPDGQVRWISALGQGTYDDKNSPIRMAGICVDITERKQVEKAQFFLLQCGWSGEDFFQSLARYLGENLGMDYVCIDRLEGDCLSARTVAIYFDGKFEDNVEYTLKDTPCGDVVGKTICSFPSQVRHLFPQDVVLQEMSAESYVGTTLWGSQGQPIGLIAIIGRKPLANPRIVESILNLVAVRAAGELERRQAEENVALLASFPELNPNPIVESDLSGHIQYLNPAARDLFPDLHPVGPSHPWVADVDVLVDKCLKGESPLQREVKIGESWYHQTINYAEKYQRLRFYGTDISALKQAEGRLLEAYKGLEQRIEERTTELKGKAELLDLAYDAIIVRDINGKIKFWNSGAEATYGWRREEVIGQITHTLLRTEFPIPLDIIEDIISHEGHWEGELIHTCKDEKQIVVHSRQAMRPGKTPGSQEIMEINHDITSHKQAEESLRQAVAYNRSLIEASLDPLVTIDPKGMISDVNTATELVTGYSRENLIGTDFSNYFSDHQKARAGYKQVFKEGFVRDYALEIRHKDGQLTPVLYNASVYKDEAEKVIGVFAAARDIAEKSKLERQLRHSQTMEVIGTLAGGISHDFNNIIAGIIGLGEMVIEDLPKGDPNHRKLELILKGAFRGRDVIKQILAFSRQGEQEKKPVSMSLILSEAMPFIRASLPSTIEIRQNNYTKSDLIPGDKTQIHQVILNLCTNAAHAMRDRGGVLEISLKDAHFEANDPDLSPELKPGPYLNLTVSDTGCGIEPEVIERIFDPFYTTKSTGEGTGLGLSVVHGIVKSHNGIIKVYSQPGQGSAFHIFIPKMVSEPSEETEEISVSPGGHEHILVVDDEEILVEMGTQRLERLGYRATGKLSSLEALEVFRNEPDKFNLVVTDYTMPNMTGLELAKEMLRIRPDLPIVMCSGLNEPVPMGKIKEIGVKEFYVKPIEKDHFATLIRRVLDQAKDQNQKESR